MFTPIEIQNHSLKTAVRGYSKKETDDFLEEILKSYEELYKENRDLKDKVSSLSEGIQYYKNMESTLQKALVLAEKTSSETQEAAKSKADSLVSEAETKATAIQKKAEAEIAALRKETEAYSEVTRAKVNQELATAKENVRKLVRSYENYRLQFIRLAESQIEMLESDHYKIFEPEISEMFAEKKTAAAEQQPVTPAESMVQPVSQAPENVGNMAQPVNQAPAESVGNTAQPVSQTPAGSVESVAQPVSQTSAESVETAAQPASPAHTESTGMNVKDEPVAASGAEEEKTPIDSIAELRKILGEPPLVLGNEPIPDTVPLPVEELRAIMASIPEIPDINIPEVTNSEMKSVEPQQTLAPQVTAPQPADVQQATAPQVTAPQPAAIQQPTTPQVTAPQPVQPVVPQQPVTPQVTVPQSVQSVVSQQSAPGRQLTTDDMPKVPSADDMPPILPVSPSQTAPAQNSPFTFIDPE